MKEHIHIKDRDSHIHCNYSHFLKAARNISGNKELEVKINVVHENERRENELQRRAEENLRPCK